MGHFYLLLALALLVLIALALSIRNSLKQSAQFVFNADQTLFTDAERRFLSVLRRAVGKDCQIYGKVRAADIIGLERRLSRRAREGALARLDGWCFDFLVCGAETSAILCAVNLAPRRPLRRAPPKNALDRICAAAHLPFVRFVESDTYSLVDVEEQVFAAIRARRIRTRPEAGLAEEVESTLNDLTLVIDEERRTSRSRLLGPRGGPTSDAGRIAPSVGKERVAGPRPLRRREPVIESHHISDEEPAFRIEPASRIEDEIEDERPMRRRRL
jgi:hypothetical protein